MSTRQPTGILLPERNAQGPSKLLRNRIRAVGENLVHWPPTGTQTRPESHCGESGPVKLLRPPGQSCPDLVIPADAIDPATYGAGRLIQVHLHI